MKLVGLDWVPLGITASNSQINFFPRADKDGSGMWSPAAAAAAADSFPPLVPPVHRSVNIDRRAPLPPSLRYNSGLPTWP